MTLEQYIEETKQRLAKFEEHWRLENSKDPENWPNEMSSGDWDEQFNIFEDE